MVHNVIQLLQRLLNLAVIAWMVLVAIFVNPVSIFICLILRFLKIKIYLKKKIDNSCWDSPCEGCVPNAPNSTLFTCTCSKFTVGTSYCQSEVPRKIIYYL